MPHSTCHSQYMLYTLVESYERHREIRHYALMTRHCMCCCNGSVFKILHIAVAGSISYYHMYNIQEKNKCATCVCHSVAGATVLQRWRGFIKALAAFATGVKMALRHAITLHVVHALAALRRVS